MLERLETKGLIERSASPEDRRIKVLHITDDGEALLRAVDGAVAQTQARILAPLSDNERRTFMKLLTKLVDINNDASRAPLGGKSVEGE